jgi:RNA polymerase sigma-70 factor (ECF subfamily)
MDLPIVWTELEGLKSGRREGLRRDDPLEREQEFLGIVERQARFMFRVAYSLLRNVQDAEDAVQEAFLKLYRGEGWRRMENERAFLARTVWRVALDRAPKAADRMDDVAGMELASSAGSPERSAAEEDERVLLRRLIEGLPEDLRQPLLLSAIEEMTSREVAAVMGIPEGTVRTRVMRARAELKKRFEAIEVRR